MIVVKLREAMEASRRRTGERVTYAKLAALTGISQETLRSIGSRLDYRPSLGNVEKLCRALDVTPGVLLELIDDPPKPKRKRTGRKA
jgi:DNA-binding Xre family transcriptional regulator